MVISTLRLVPFLKESPVPAFADYSSPWGLLRETAQRYPEVRDDLEAIKNNGREPLKNEIDTLLAYGYRRSKDEDRAAVLSGDAGGNHRI